MKEKLKIEMICQQRECYLWSYPDRCKKCKDTHPEYFQKIIINETLKGDKK